jgi:hypothetical protein
MEETIKERVIKIAKHKGLTQSGLERECNLSNGYIRNIRATPSQKIIDRILKRFPDISLRWLLNGVGDMCCSDISDEELQRQVDEANARDQHIGGNSSHNTQTMTENNDVVIGMLRDQLAEKNEEIKFLRSLIAEMNQNK